MSDMVDPTLHVVHAAEHAFVVSARPELTELRGAWWWVRVDDAWYRMAQRGPNEVTRFANAEAWLHENLQLPRDGHTVSECGPAWWASRVNPLVIDTDRGCFSCYPSEAPASNADDAVEYEPQWIVDCGTLTLRMPLDCDDNVVDVYWNIDHALSGEGLVGRIAPERTRDRH